MPTLLGHDRTHVLAALLLFARLGDIGTTYLATPRLILEANPIAKRLGWPYALATLLVAFVPYGSPEVGLVALVMSLFVSSSNASKIWAMRTMGEEGYRAYLRDLARKSRLRWAIGPHLASASFLSIAGVLLIALSDGPEADLVSWFGVGILVYAAAVTLYGVRYYLRLFRAASHV